MCAPCGVMPTKEGHPARPRSVRLTNKGYPAWPRSVRLTNKGYPAWPRSVRLAKKGYPAWPPSGARLAVAVLWLAALGAVEAAASHGEMRRVGEHYAVGDVTRAVAILGDIIGRGGKTLWMSEALLFRAKIREKDLGERRSALRDLRDLTVQFPGTAASAFGQFRIARLYESSGLLADAYREYVLCSRLRGFAYRPHETTRRPAGPGDVPVPRITPAGARELVELARERAACLFGRIPVEVAGETSLPPGTFVVAGGAKPLGIPVDSALRSASGGRSGVWYAVAPHGRSIAGVSVEFVAAVDHTAAGPQGQKRYSIVVGPLPRVPGRPTLALCGAKRRSEKLTGELRLDGGTPALKISVYRSGARVLGCKARVTLGDSPAGPPEAPEPPAGFAFAVPPASRGGAGGVSIARTEDGISFLVFHRPGPAAPDPDDDADLFLARSADGRMWQEPKRLAVSSATDDRDPAVAVLRDGRLLLAWTSSRRGPGASDVFLSTSPDGAKWSKPYMLKVAPDELEGMGLRVYAGARAVRPAAHVMFHKPEISVDSAGRARVFFVAHGFRHEPEGGRYVGRLSATGLFGVVSTDLRRWTKPITIVATPKVHLDRFRPAPKGTSPEVVSALVRPAVIEREPGRSLVAWASTYGRVFLSIRDSRGRWAHTDARFAGKDPASAADGVRLLGPLEGQSYGVLVLRRDVGPRVFWRDRAAKTGWRTYRLEAEVPRTGLAEVDLAPLPGGRSWLSAWTAVAVSEPTGVYVREITAPKEEPAGRR